MKPKSLQQVLGAVLVLMGGWCAFFPRMVEQLTIRQEYQHLSATTAVFIACFGAQAVLCGTIILLSRFEARTFLGFGLLGSIPFFAFNYYFCFVEPIFTKWMLLDVVGNVVILVCGIYGFIALSRAGESSALPAAPL